MLEIVSLLTGVGLSGDIYINQTDYFEGSKHVSHVSNVNLFALSFLSEGGIRYPLKIHCLLV